MATYILLVILIIAAYTDLKDRKVKNILIKVGLFIGLLYPAFTETTYIIVLKNLIISSLIMISIWIIARGKLGGGDIKLSILIGLFLGWPMALITLFISQVLSLALVPYFLIKRISLRTEVPLAPFILISFILLNFYLFK